LEARLCLLFYSTYSPPARDQRGEGRKMAMMMGSLFAILANLIGSGTYPLGFAANDKSMACA
jgi:hypothetical protein